MRLPGSRIAVTLIAWTVPVSSFAMEPAEALRQTVAPFSAADVDFFERKIRPLLVESCYECHSEQAKSIKGGLRLDARRALLTGGDSGPAVMPGEPESSMLIAAVRQEGLEMPPSGKLDRADIELLEDWVRRGAPMPKDSLTSMKTPQSIDFEAGRKFWSFRPLSDPKPPHVDTTGKVTSAIDAYVATELHRHGLTRSPPADRRTLIRRASLDVLGLPPSPDEVAAFERDNSPDAYARLIDRLLASPHYGERWARHWLDLARYSDATASWLSSIAQAWHYRDWVIQALNDDLPYDEFVRKQLAADQLADAEPADIAALGFLGLSPAYWKELKLDPAVIQGTVAEEWEERVDAIGRTFLGLTIACARCHDHKFDPISTADYYAFAGVVANTRLIDRPVIPADAYARVEQARSEVEALRSQLKSLQMGKEPAADVQQQIAELKQKIEEVERSTLHYGSAVAHAVDDAALIVEADGPDATKLTYKPGKAFDLAIQIRGNPSNLGPVVPRRFLTIFAENESQPFANGSGRKELAEAIVTDASSLTARVIANRMWSHYFGRGLVDTPSDFGTQGSRPTHPALLDYLASRLVTGGWSLKSLHREILLSATYQQASAASSPEQRHALTTDPENRWLSRMARKPIDVEAWRDGILAAAGVLDTTIGGLPQELSLKESVRRTVYGRVDRYELDDLLRLYDFPDPLGHSPRRHPTTTPLQQLFVLNSPFLQQQAERLATRVCNDRPEGVADQLDWAYRLLFGRAPTQTEQRLGTAFLTGGTDEAGDLDAAWVQYAQVLLGSNELFFVD